ncbi:MAG: pseudaminic acid synthase [Candidatus Tantalella remota]|nr:pseudaminic acid synthase [Candidatus Tantalella remota]
MKYDIKTIFKGEADCQVVAEVSANHGQDIQLALTMIKQAAKCGADAVKFQAYTPDTLTLDSKEPGFVIDHPEWGGQTLHELYRKAYTPWEWFGELKKTCEDCGVLFFATAFDNSSVDMLEDLNVKVHKIASFELVDIPLIKYAAGTKKPIILSTGMATLEEIGEAFSAARDAGADQVFLLKCVSSYPADPADMNLRTMEDMRERFGAPVGISDHSKGTAVSVASVAMGAKMVEKHFALAGQKATADSFFSLDASGLNVLVREVRETEKALGGVNYGPTDDEKKSIFFRRSLFVVKDVCKGEEFSADNIRSIRPSSGLAPKEFGNVLGRKASKDIKRGTPLKVEHVEGFKRA